MKYLKMLTLAAVAASALMAFIGAGTASATVLCSTTTGDLPCPTAQKIGNIPLLFSLEGSALLKETGAEGKVLDTCKGSEVGGEITNTGSATSTVSGKNTKLTWTSCTFPTATTELGKLEIHRIAGTSNGTLTAGEGGASPPKVTINTILFGSCIYAVEAGKSIGDLTEGKTGSATPPIFHANAVAKRQGVNPACPETSVWTATYVMTEPKETTVSVSDSTD
jgi:hypothetical protein